MGTLPFSASTTAANTNMRYVSSLDVSETAAAAAKVILRDGSSSGSALAEFALAAGADAHRSWIPPLFAPLGLYIHVSTGAVRGSVIGQ